MVQGHEAPAQAGHAFGVVLDLLVQDFRILFHIDPVGKIIVDDFFLDVNF